MGACRLVAGKDGRWKNDEEHAMRCDAIQLQLQMGDAGGVYGLHQAGPVEATGRATAFHSDRTRWRGGCWE